MDCFDKDIYIKEQKRKIYLRLLKNISQTQIERKSLVVRVVDMQKIQV